ncbi:hypothetical protein MN116_008825, partial [Schistosoma mekongi]
VLFLSISVNCYTVQKASILGLYESFVEVTLDAGRSSQARTDWYTYPILYGLPYSGHLLAAHDLSALNDILGTLEVYMAKHQCPHVSLLRVWESDDPHPQENYLDCLWAQICNLRNGGWVEKVTWRLYDSFPSLKEHGQPHKLSPLTPPDYDAEVIYPLPSVIFRISELLPDGGAKFTKEAPVLPGAHTIERFLIDEHLAILMYNLSFNRVMWFIEWFSYHLSNYQLQWSWKEWSSSLTLDPMSPQKRLITEALCRLIRFSYFENVKRLLPKSFYILLPPQPTVINKYESNPDLPSTRTFFRLVDSIRGRLEPQTVLRIAETASQCRGRRRSISEPFDNDGVIRDVEEKYEEDESSDDSHSDHSDVERHGKSPIDTIPLSDPEFDELNDSEPAK